MAKFRKLTLLCTAILACGVMASTTGCALSEYIPELPDWLNPSTGVETPVAVKYTIKFVNADGTVLQENEVEEGQMPTYTGEMPVKAATAQYTYTFAGWDSEIVAATADAVYTATFTETVNNYVVSFDTDGGSAVEAQTVPYGTSASGLEQYTSEKTGYTFAGWTLENGDAIPENAMVTENVTLKAIWTANTNTAYIVKHYQQNLANNEYTEVTADVENKTGTTAMITSATAKTYEGFTAKAFEQVTIAADGSTVVEIYYDRNTYTVSFVENGGSEVADIENVKYGATISAPQSTKAGYTLAWDYDFTQAITGNKTITANWTANTNTAYNVEVYAEKVAGGYELLTTIPKTGTTDTTATLGNAELSLVPIGFVFDDTNENNVVSGTIAGDGSLVLKAYINRQTYLVEYYDYDGTHLSDETVKYQANATYNVVPTRTASDEVLWAEFAGWVTENGEVAELSNVTADLTVYASYTEHGYSGVYVDWAKGTNFTKNWSATLSTSTEQAYGNEGSSLKVAQTTADWGNGLMLNIDNLYAALSLDGVVSLELTFRYYVAENSGNKFFAVGCQDIAKSQAIGSLNTWNTATFTFTKADITKPNSFIIGLSGNSTMSWQAAGTTSTYYISNIEYKVNTFKATGVYADWSKDIAFAKEMFESKPAASTEQVYGTETSSVKASSSGWGNGIGLDVNTIVNWLAMDNVASVSLTFKYYLAENSGNKYFVAGNQGKAKSQAIGSLNTWNTATFTFAASDITSPGGFVVGFSGNATMDWQATNTTSTFYLGNVEYKINTLEPSGVYVDWTKDSGLVKSIFATPSVSDEQVYGTETKSIKAVTSSGSWGNGIILNVDQIVAWLSTGKVESVSLTFSYYIAENSGNQYFTAGCQDVSVSQKIGALNTWNTVTLTLTMDNITKQNTFMIGLSPNATVSWSSASATSIYYLGNIYYELNLA